MWKKTIGTLKETRNFQRIKRINDELIVYTIHTIFKKYLPY